MYNLVVKNKLTPEQRQKVEQLIIDVWSFEQQTKADVELLDARIGNVSDTLDHAATHILVDDGSRLIGYGRLTVLKPSRLGTAHKELPFEIDHQKSAYISRLVVHPTARGRGIAGLIDEARISQAKSEGIEVIMGCAVGTQRQISLAKVGFHSEGP
ncbi:MAG: GNAT family N-acetyltransferase, partial [Proteobacteria bacterium]|nr:GNAT family N-acetyltransferase [Pseudomonadota bacterium]